MKYERNTLIKNIIYRKQINGCQTSNVWRQNTSCLIPYQNMLFVLCSHLLDATGGIPGTDDGVIMNL